MRITDSTVYNKVKQQVSRNKERLDLLNTQISSGQIVQKLGDNPIVLAQSLRSQRYEAELGQFGKTQVQLTERFNLYENASQEAYEVLSKFKADLVRLSTSTESASDVKAELSAQIKQVREQLLGVANQKHEGQALFSGALTDQDAYSADGAYHGDGTINEVEVMPGVKLEGNITGDTLFSWSQGGATTNVFEMLNNLEAALSANDPRTAAQDQINTATNALNQVTYSQIQIGVSLSRVQASSSSLEKLKTNLSEYRLNTESVDYTTAITDYKATEVALQASLQTSSSILQKSLLDYLS